MSNYILLEADEEAYNGDYEESEEFVSKEDRGFINEVDNGDEEELVFTERSIKS